jgi:cation transport ATPase
LDRVRQIHITMNGLEQLLARPLEHRLREYKYRCAQALVFGLPVVALQYVGTALGGPEAPRYVAVLQALLAGWVMYVGAAGMLVEGWIVIHRRGLTIDFCVAFAAIALYVFSLVAAAHVVATGRGVPPAFHVSVVILAIWTGIRWTMCLYSVRHSDPRGE